VCVTVNQSVVISREPEGPPVPSMTLAEMNDLYRYWNARKARPNPVCPLCRMPFSPGDCDAFDSKVCCTCGINRLEKACRRLFKARSKKAKKRALRRLLKLSK
jgi:hypothetical protein